MKTFFKAFFSTLILLIVLFVGSIVVFGIKSHIDDPMSFFRDLKEPTDRINFLLMGTDAVSRDGVPSRTDVMMLVNIDLVKKEVNMVAIPRDTKVTIPNHKRSAKINAAFAYGGSELALETVNYNFGTNIEHYVTMDYGFVEEIVNLVGGVEVDVPQDMDYEDPWDNPPLSIHLKKGYQNLDGKQSVGFLRFRKGYVDQDLGRIKAQQMFMAAFLAKVKSPRTIIMLPGFLNAYDKHTENNLPLGKIAKAAPLARGFGSDTMNTYVIPGVPRNIRGVSYVVYDEEGTNDLLTSVGLK